MTNGLDEEALESCTRSSNASNIPSSATAIAIRNALCNYIDRTEAVKIL